jgi:Icc-related predicted phosphoesterase
VIRHLTVAGATPRRIRLLAVSDETDSSLWEHLDRNALGPLDMLVSCGDLPPDYLSYLEGVLRVPFVFVRGNHDLDEAWRHEAARLLPAPHRERLLDVAGLDVVALDWPGLDKERTAAQDRGVWGEVLGIRLGAALRRRHPLIVASHVAPHDAGDSRDAYHRGFRGYRWLAEHLHPALWLHGHTTPASVPERVTHIGSTTCVNVTGAYLIELA